VLLRLRMTFLFRTSRDGVGSTGDVHVFQPLGFRDLSPYLTSEEHDRLKQKLDAARNDLVPGNARFEHRSANGHSVRLVVSRAFPMPHIPYSPFFFAFSVLSHNPAGMPVPERNLGWHGAFVDDDHNDAKMGHGPIWQTSRTAIPS
jgi:hypothetical protein